MNYEIDFSSQTLGALIDRSVDPATVDWIQSLCEKTMIRIAKVTSPAEDCSLRNLGNRLLVGEIDLILFLSAAGVSAFLDRLSQWIARSRLVDAISDIRTVAVGPNAAGKLREHGVEPSITINDIENWRELLVRLERTVPLDNLRVGLEKTPDVRELTAGLEARGVLATSFDTAAYERSDPTSSEQDLLDAIEDSNLGALLFPNPACAARFGWLVSRRPHPILNRNCRQLVILVLDRETEKVLADSGMQADIVLRQPR